MRLVNYVASIFWAKLQRFDKQNLFYFIQKQLCHPMWNLPPGILRVILKLKNKTWNLSMTSPTADKPFSLSIFCLFLLSVCLLDSLCICSCPRRRKAGILPSLEDLLFYTIAEGQEKIPAHKFTTVKPHTSWSRRARPLLPYLL